MFKGLFRTGSSASFLFLRLALGIVMFPHGAQKVLGWYGGPGYEKTIEIFTTNMHFPLLLVILLMTAEFVGSLFIIIGFLTRVWALAIGTSMSVCAYMNHLQHGFFMNWFGNQKGEGFEFHILVVGIALALVIGGSGPLSVDKKLGK